jgi:hypothetical protein
MKSTVLKWLGLALFASCLLTTSRAYAEIEMTTKRLVILRPGVESLWGSYIFAIGNTGSEPEEIETSFKLPAETVDWMPQEGVLPKDIRLGSEGNLILKATYPPGVHMISIGFKIDSSGADTTVTLKPVDEISDFTLLFPDSTNLKVTHPNLQDSGLDGNAQEPYRTMKSANPLPKGEEFVMNVSGIPEGRTKPYVVGAIIGLLFVVASTILAIKTRPKGLEDENALLLTSN